MGAQCKSCLKPDCEQCSEGIENHCTNDFVQTYGAKYQNGDTAQGGYAKYWRGNSHFVFHIPDAIPSEMAAPMLCGGVTTYSPLKQNGCGPGKKVGVIGIGGKFLFFRPLLLPSQQTQNTKQKNIHQQSLTPLFPLPLLRSRPLRSPLGQSPRRRQSRRHLPHTLQRIRRPQTRRRRLHRHERRQLGAKTLQLPRPHHQFRLLAQNASARLSLFTRFPRPIYSTWNSGKSFAEF